MNRIGKFKLFSTLKSRKIMNLWELRKLHTHIIAKKKIGGVGNATQLCSCYYYIRESISRGNFILQENGNDWERD